MSRYGRFEDGVHITSFPVYYEDTDAAGIVYYANYLKFAERARTDALRSIGISQQKLMAKDQLGFVVTQCSMALKASARLDDELQVETSLQELKKVRMTMQQRILKQGVLLADLSVQIAMVNQDQKPTRIPESIMQALTEHMLNRGQ